jgi:hypothetical protein
MDGCCEIGMHIQGQGLFVVTGKHHFYHFIWHILPNKIFRYSLLLLPDLSSKDNIYGDICKGTYDADHFVAYIGELLSLINPRLELHSVLVVDNCRVHHAQEVAELCNERNVSCICMCTPVV